MEKTAPIQGAKYLKSTEDTCPRCNALLDLYALHGMKLEGCPKNHGFWLLKDELRKLKNKFDLGQLHWLNAEVDNIENTTATPANRSCPKHDGGQLLSVLFGHSSVTIDWCPKCHGLWLDRGEFNKIIEYLVNELGDSSLQDVEKEIARDIKNVETGRGPEGPLAELSDIAAAITAMINFSIFEHPRLFKLLMDVQAGGRGVSMD